MASGPERTRGPEGPAAPLEAAVVRALEASGVGVATLHGTRLVQASAAVGRLLGRPEAELAALPSLVEAFAPKDRDAFQRRLAGPEVVFVGEITGRWPDGGEIPLEYTLHRLADGRNLLLLRDLSRRKALETALQARDAGLAEIERLREMDRLKGQFVNMAAHELRTPLTPIRLQLHVLRTTGAGRFTPEQQRSLEVLERNITRLNQLIQDILDGARLQAGRFSLQRRRIDLVPLLEEAADAFREPARAAGVELRLETAGPIHVEGDANRLTQVLYNLLSNAVKFTPSGGRIELQGRNGGTEAVVTVRDSGIGLLPEQVERLFRPFVQVHDQMQSSRPGTGLGLFISKGIADLHGGRIRCESGGPGLGTTFVLTLPAWQATPGTHAEVAAQQRASQGDAFARRVRELI